MHLTTSARRVVAILSTGNPSGKPSMQGCGSRLPAGPVLHISAIYTRTFESLFALDGRIEIGRNMLKSCGADSFGRRITSIQCAT